MSGPTCSGIDEVGPFVYLGSVVTKEDGTMEDIKSQWRKANLVFVRLYPVLKNYNLSNTNVKSVLSNGSET